MTTNEILDGLNEIFKHDESQAFKRMKTLIRQLKPQKVSKDEEDYVQGKGLRCPVCASTEIEGQEFNADGGIVTQEMGCNECGASWTDQYRLTGYFGLERG